MIEKQEEYIPADQAIALLGVKAPKFFYHADRGEIRTEAPSRPGKGKKNNRYLVADILAVKQRLQEKRHKPAPVKIDWLLSEDIPAGLKLDHQVYGEEIDLAEAAVYQGWRKHNRQITLAAFSLDRKECYASLQVIPVAETLILDILAGRRTESSISPDEIHAYDTPGAYTLLVTSAVCLKDRPLLLFELLSRYMQFWIDMYPEKYISKVYAQAMSERGIMMVQHLFMTPRYDLAYNAYELDMSRPSASRIIRNFKKQLQAKAPLPIDLQWPPITPQEKPLASPTDAPVIWKDATPQTPIERPLISPTTPPTIWQTVIPPMRPKEPQIATTEDLDGVSLRTFASIHHINPRTATDQARIGTGGEILDVTEREAGRGKDKWFVTPEQQHQAIAFWQKHKTPGFTPCPDCPH